jgi:hypothetical protein
MVPSRPRCAGIVLLPCSLQHCPQPRRVSMHGFFSTESPATKSATESRTIETEGGTEGNPFSRSLPGLPLAPVSFGRSCVPPSTMAFVAISEAQPQHGRILWIISEFMPLCSHFPNMSRFVFEQYRHVKWRLKTLL